MEGAHVIGSEAESAPPVPMLGHVTSSYFSPNVDRSIAMALVKGGRSRMGERLWVSRRDGAPIPVDCHRHGFPRGAGEGQMAERRSPLRRSPLFHRPPIEGEGGRGPHGGAAVPRKIHPARRSAAGGGAAARRARARPAVRSADQRDRRRNVVPVARAGRVDARDRARRGGSARREPRATRLPACITSSSMSATTTR